MKILLDENVPRPLKRFLADHEVSSVQDCGWRGVRTDSILDLCKERVSELTHAGKLTFNGSVMGKLLALLVVGAVGYFAWQHFNKPEPAPPVPEKRLAPPGVYYVVKKFSVEHEDGLYSFPVLKKVNLVREENGQFVVSDGKLEATASASSFTNDLDQVDAIRASLPIPTPAPSVAPPPTDAEKKVKILKEDIKSLVYANENFGLAIAKLQEIKNPGTRNISGEIAEITSKIRRNNLIIAEKQLAIKKIEENL